MTSPRCARWAFPFFARGVLPVPGTKKAVEPLNGPVRCGGVSVDAGDIVVADEEGVVVTPCARREQVLLDARKKPTMEAGESFHAWEEAHRTRIDKILAEGGFEG